ncbi:MAG: hypothetical protein GY745_10510, partial [Actinomycetia bacterium]|nr:hypothetical protein [Actinomycetes bacterium]
GYISLHRKILESWLWNEKPFSKGQAWIDLLMCAAYTDTDVFIRQSLIKLKRGQQARSIASLANAWGWSTKKVRNFLSVLDENRKIDLQKGNLTSVITICNYDSYQAVGTARVMTEDSVRTRKGYSEIDINSETDPQKGTLKGVVSDCNYDSYKTSGATEVMTEDSMGTRKGHSKIDINLDKKRKIDPEKDTLEEVVSGCNYNSYEAAGTAEVMAEDFQRTFKGNGKGNPNNNINKINNINNNPQAGARDGGLVSPSLI